MTQLPLTYRPAAAKADPSTSHLAAAELERSGKRETRARRAARIVAANPGLTTRELSERTGIEHHELQKGLSDAVDAGLLKKGAIRKCGVTGNPVLTWEVAP